jgi:hypothetical protein
MTTSTTLKPALRAVYASTIFLGAFLVFQVQPLVAKTILPWFGGSSAVWTTAMLFFQATLLAGYAYAHVVGSMRSVRAQKIIHLCVLVAAVASLPILPDPQLKPTGSEEPISRILVILATSVGLPYLVVSSTGPLVQRWYVMSAGPGSPYRYFSLSNAGSLLGLVSYPFVIEPALGQVSQSTGWSIAFAVQALAYAAVAVSVPKGSGRESLGGPDEHPLESVGWREWMWWVVLPAIATLLLLAFTNQICQDVASAPFLWVVPLTLYLLSFILAFAERKWYRRGLFAVALLVALEATWTVVSRGLDLELWLQVSLLSGALFVVCMVCHGELHLRRPDPRRLTGYYLLISVGGALGGFLAAVVAPLVFDGYLELHVGLVAAGVAAAISYRRPDPDTGAALPVRAQAGFSAVAGLLLLAIAWQGWNDGRGFEAASRSFYGVLRVEERSEGTNADRVRIFTHGRINHGFQFLDAARRNWPTAYFGTESGVGKVLDTVPGSRRIGVVGLGVGTLAVYGRSGDHMVFYELDPNVVGYAENWFSYLSGSAATIETRVGDGRLLLDRELADAFDILVLDAFSSDSIPVHLLTAEAFAIYDRVLADGGVLAMNGTNRHVDIAPIVARLGGTLDGRPPVLELSDAGNPAVGTYPSRWLVSTHDDGVISALREAGAVRLTSDPEATPLWTDDRSDLLGILKWGR